MKNYLIRVKTSIYFRLRKLCLRLFPELQDITIGGCTYPILHRERNTIKGTHVNLMPIFQIYNSKIGDYTYIARNATISMTTIGKFCSIGPNLMCGWGIHPTDGLSTAPMFYSTMRQNGMTLSNTDKVIERKPITIGNDVFIGANVTILDGITIGDGAVIGAGAVVSKDIPPYAVAVGCPIKVLKYRFPEDKIHKLRKIEWWNFSDDQLKDVERMFFDVDAFIEKYSM